MKDVSTRDDDGQRQRQRACGMLSNRCTRPLDRWPWWGVRTRWSRRRRSYEVPVKPSTSCSPTSDPMEVRRGEAIDARSRPTRLRTGPRIRGVTSLPAAAQVTGTTFPAQTSVRPSVAARLVGGRYSSGGPGRAGDPRPVRLRRQGRRQRPDGHVRILRRLRNPGTCHSSEAPAGTKPSRISGWPSPGPRSSSSARRPRRRPRPRRS